MPPARKAVSMIIGFAGLLGSTAAAQDPAAIDIDLEACRPEVETWCSQVAPGEGRLLACFYAHEDKLSDRCGFALYRAAATLQEHVAKLGHAANACAADLTRHCADVAPGEGRLLACLDTSGSDVSDACKQALRDTGLKR